MTDAINAIDGALFVALSAIVWTTPGVAVHQHPARNAPMPMVIVGDVDNGAPIGRAGDPDRHTTVDVISLTEGEERGPCAAMVGQIDALDGQALSFDGWRIALALVASSCTVAEDGLGYAGISRFSVTALKQ